MNEMENAVLENENPAADNEVAENAGQAAEESVAAKEPKLYTEAQLNAKVDEIIGRAKPKIKARAEAKVRRELESEYGDLTDVLRAGMGKSDIKEITDDLRKHYGGRGVPIPERVSYSAGDTAILARADAKDIIDAGYDEVVEEVDRLTRIGTANMTPRERESYKLLCEHRASAERTRELAAMGVNEEVYGSEDFKNFAAKINSSVPIKEVYEMYQKQTPKKQFRIPGSMKNTGGGDAGLKDFYSFEEASKFTREDFDKNPELFKRVQASMPKWK